MNSIKFISVWKYGKEYLVTQDRIDPDLVTKLGLGTTKKELYFVTEAPLTPEAMVQFKDAFLEEGITITVVPFSPEYHLTWGEPFSGFHMMMKPLEEAKSIAEELINKFHKQLKGATIGYYLLDKDGPINAGIKTCAFAQKISGMMQYFSKLDFIIFVYRDVWSSSDDKYKKALVDHELSHCVKSAGNYKTKSHDFADFYKIIERHGDILNKIPVVKENEEIKTDSEPLTDVLTK